MADNDTRNVNPNNRSAEQVSVETEAMNVSIGTKMDKVESDGITIRGCGAATKGTKARGPMA